MLSLERVAALRHCCPSDSNAELGRIAWDRGLSLLDALPSAPWWEAADHCCNAIKRPAASEASGASKRPRTKLPARGRQDYLGVMLEDAASEVGLMFEEAASAEAYQREFESASEGAVTPSLRQSSRSQAIQKSVTAQIVRTLTKCLVCGVVLATNKHREFI